MKYVYVKNRNTLDVARHEIISEDQYCYVIEADGVTIPISRQSPQFIISALHGNFEIISYQEYVAIVNGIIEKKLEALHQMYLAIGGEYWKAKEGLKAEKLPMDEVTE